MLYPKQKLDHFLRKISVFYGFRLGFYCLLLHVEVEAGLCTSTDVHGLNDELGFWGRGRGRVGWCVVSTVQVKESDSTR